MVKSPPRSSLGKKSYCQFSEGPLFGLLGTGVTVAPLSGYAKPDECPSYRRLRTHRIDNVTRFHHKCNDELLLHSPDIVIFQLISVAIGLY